MARLSAAEVKFCALIAPDYEVDQSALLFFCTRSAIQLEDRTELARLVVPEQLERAFLHHYHTCLEGGHQESADLINGSAIIFIGLGCTEVCRDMWESVWIVKQEKDDQVIGEDHLVIFNQRTLIRL